MMANAALFFFISLGFCYFIVLKSSNIRGLTVRFADILQRRAFPSTSDFEHIKFAFLRIIFGILLLNRDIQIFSALLPEEIFTPVGYTAMAALAAAICVTFGFMTQWALLFLMFFMWHIGEQILSTSTLGNDIAASLSLLLLLTSAGKFLSIDGLLTSRVKHKIWFDFLLYDEGIPSRRSIALAKFVSLLTYFMVCVYSICVHLNEPAWMNGVAGPYLLTNNFMSVFYQNFTQWFTEYPLAVHIAKISLWVMMLWYPSLIPFSLLGGVFRSYVIWWGILFFIMSSFVLRLGSLAEFEFVMWAGFFWATTGLDKRKKLSVFYDDTCNLCDRTVLAITYLDIFNRVTLRPLSKHGEALQAYGVKPEAAMENLYGVQEENGPETGKVTFGYDFYVALSKNLFLLWPVVPFLYLGKWLCVGPAIYNLVARKRHEIFGFCKVPTKKVVRAEPVTKDDLTVFGTAVKVHVVLLAFCYMIATPLPYLGVLAQGNAGARAAAYYGIAPINVFNRDDLRIAENWFTLRDVKNDRLMPILTKEGVRLGLHRSDRVYFGHTLMFRRLSIGTEGCLFNNWQPMLTYLSKVSLYRMGAPAGIYQIEYVQYHQSLPDEEKVLNGEYVVEPITSPCTKTFEVNYAP